MKCSHCGASSAELLLCSGCKVDRYCNAACQRSAWRLHKTACMARKKFSEELYPYRSNDPQQISHGPMRFGFAERVVSLPLRERRPYVGDMCTSTTVSERTENIAHLMAALETDLVAACFEQAAPPVDALAVDLLIDRYDPAVAQGLSVISAQLQLEPFFRTNLFGWAVLLSTVEWSEESAARCLDMFRIVVRSTSHDALRGYVQRHIDPFPLISLICKDAPLPIRAEVVRLLLQMGTYTEAGTAIPATRKEFTRAVTFTVACGPAEVLRLLLEAGADPRTSVDDNVTWLHAVGEPDTAEKVQLLVDAGASLESRDCDGYTPLECALLGSVPSCSMFDALLAAGADPLPLGMPRAIPGLDTLTYTIISVAGRGDLDAMRRLLDLPAGIMDVSVRRSDDGASALDVAAMFDRHHMVKMLIEAGADAQAVGPMNGFTALTLAANRGSHRAAKALIQAGGLTRRGPNGKTGQLLFLNALKNNAPALAAISNCAYFESRRTPEEIREGVMKIIALLEQQ